MTTKEKEELKTMLRQADANRSLNKRALKLIEELEQENLKEKTNLLDWVASNGYKPDRRVEDVNYWMKFVGASQMPCGTSSDIVLKHKIIYDLEKEIDEETHEDTTQDCNIR